MTDTTNYTAEGVPNPYNQRKSWHKEGGEAVRETADSLFVPPKQTVESSNEDTSNEQNHDWKQRHGHLQTQYDDTKATLSDTQTQLVKLQDKFKALEGPGESNQQTPVQPVVQEPVTPVVSTENSDRLGNIESKLSDISKRESVIRRDQALTEVVKAHPEYTTFKDSDEFHKWAASKSETIRNAIYKNPYDSQAAIEALDLYKYESAKAAQAKQAEQQASQNEADASSLISTRNTEGAVEANQPKVWKTSEIKRLTNSGEIVNFIDEINKAQREGRIIRD